MVTVIVWSWVVTANQPLLPHVLHMVLLLWIETYIRISNMKDGEQFLRNILHNLVLCNMLRNKCKSWSRCYYSSSAAVVFFFVLFDHHEHEVIMVCTVLYKLHLSVCRVVVVHLLIITYTYIYIL